MKAQNWINHNMLCIYRMPVVFRKHPSSAWARQEIGKGGTFAEIAWWLWGFFFLLSSLMLFVEEICPQFSSSSRKARSRNSNWKLTWQLLCSTKLVELWGIYFAFIMMFPPPGKLETNKASNYSSKSQTTLAINFHDLRRKSRILEKKEAETNLKLFCDLPSTHSSPHFN